MLAKPTGDAIPVGDYSYEPKWDGFRCLIFRNGGEVVVQSRNGEDISYAFPEIVAAALVSIPERIVLDGELVIAAEGRLWFERLGMRIRPRGEAGGWKIAELAEQYPASYVAFDLLAEGDDDLTTTGHKARRERLEAVAMQSPFFVTPATTDPTTAAVWFDRFEGAGLDGVIAKPQGLPYQPGKRVLLKVKHRRTVDVVVAGWRPHKSPAADGRPVVGSLLLGLYDDSGVLHNVGVASSFSAARREELARELEPLELGDDDSHPWLQRGTDPRRRVPGSPSRWSGGKDLSFHPLRPEVVAEVAIDHMEGTRFRHVATLQRFRPDREPASCTYEQVAGPEQFDVGDVVPGLG